ncbi:hypothetical protein TNCV_703721 [Trichonephila clavipes]|nr:hypothetical protein TNCV_703721 [Trichonephila clavipes]
MDHAANSRDLSQELVSFAEAGTLSSEFMAAATLDAAHLTTIDAEFFNARLARHHTPVTTVDELWHRVEAALASVPVHAIQSLFDSMPRRIIVVITARGGCSGY